MATTKRKSTVNPEVRTSAVALAVATAFLPWYLPQMAHGQTVAPDQMPSVTVRDGQAYIRDAAGTYQRIDQASLRAIYEGSMTMGLNAHLHLQHEHGRAGIGFFRDVSGSLTQIFGKLTSNGQIFISNQNGVLFGASARVDVGALFATSLSIKDQDFMAGRYNFYNEGNAGSVVNEGNIVTANGYTALVGPQVRNDGIIIARAGTVALAAGDRVTLDMIGDGLISLSVDQSAYNASVVNTGNITADGGTVLLTARSANALLDTVINNSGTIRANSLVERNGEIILDGGNAGVVANSGTLTVAGTDTGTTGGTVKVLGEYVGLFDGTHIDASGDVGGGTVLVGGNYQGKGSEQNASRTFVGRDVTISADARTNGDGGKVIVWADDTTAFYGQITARGGAQAGDGGFVEVSGKDNLTFAGGVDTSAPNGEYGTLLLDPTNLDIVTGVVGTGDRDPALLLGTGTIAFGDADIGGNTLTVSQINTIGATNDIVLNAGGLTFNNTDDITLGAARSFTINVDNTQVGALGGTNNIANAGANAFSINTSGGGAVSVNAGGSVNLANVTLSTSGAGGVSVVGTAGPVTLGPVTTASGDVSANSGAGITLTGAISGGGSTTLTGAGTVALGGNAVSGTSVSITATGAASDITSTAGGTITSSSTTVQLTAGRHIQLQAAISAATSVIANFAQSAAGTFSTTAAMTGNTSVGINSFTAGSTFDFSGAPAITATLTGSGSDTLIGRNVASTWSVDGGTYTDGTGTFTFSGMSTLQGGSAIDTFNVGSAAMANLNGGAGVDVFALATNTLTGSIDGQVDGGSITGIDSATLTTQGGTTGFNGTSANVSGGFSNVTSLSGSGTLTGRDVDSTWTLDGTPTYSDGSRTLDVTGFATLAGGTGIDTFDVTAASVFTLNGGAGVDLFNLNATLTGSIDGQADGATLDGTNVLSANLTGAGAIGYNGSTDATALTGTFSNITAINGNGGGTLTGTNNVSGWSALNGTGGSYTDNGGINSVAFTNFATLQGGSAIDTFALTGGATFVLNGGGAVDVFALASNTLTGTINGEAAGGSITGLGSATLTGTGTPGYNGSSANVSGGFSNITNLSGTNTLTGTNTASSWSALNGTSGSYSDNGGTNTATFSGFSTLQGGSAIDTFTLSGAATFNLAGGGAVDVFALASNTLTGTINGEAAGGSITGLGSATLTGTGTPGYNGTSANVSGGFSNITDLSGTGTLTGTNTASSWAALNGTSGSYSDNGGTNTATFSGFGTLQGGSAVDTFTLTGAATFNLAGGDGVDIFALATNTLTGSINGQVDGGSITGIGSATLTTQGATTGFNGTSANVSGGFSNIASLSGSGTLTGRDVDSTWTLDGTPTYSDGSRTLDVTGFATLAGGTGIDTFDVTAASVFTLNGGAGVDLFNLNATLTGSIDGQADGATLDGTNVASVNVTGAGTVGYNGSTDATALTGTFSNVTTINANGGGTLTGTANASAWSLSGTAGTYTDNGGTNSVAFSNFATLQGGTAIDTFTLAAASTFNLAGGGAVDVFALAGNTLTGAIAGQAAGGSITGIGSAVLTQQGATTGFDGMSANVSGNFTDITSISGTGTLTGDDAVSSWAVNGTAGTYTSGNALTFSGFATLQGGTAVDTFTLGGAATFNLNGGDGVDVFALGGNTLTGAVAGEAAGGSITGVGSAVLTQQGATTGFDGTSADVSTGFSNITSLSGTGTLTGDDVASTWALDGTPTYSDGSRTLDIAGFANLQGGTAADTFNVTLASTFNLLGGAGADVFTINAPLTGTVSGETGSDTLQGTQIGSTTLTASTLADGFSGTTTGVTAFSGIDVLNGSGTLTGRDVASTWSVDGATYTDGTATLAHSGYGTLQGGTAIDTFNLAGAATANLLGGDGADVFNINAALTGSVNGEVGNDLLSGSTTYVVNAANAGTASNVSAGFTSIENLAGTGGADSFTLSAGGALTGTIDGLAGIDTLTSDNANTWTITGPNSGTLTGTGGWLNIENLVGGTSTDSFIGAGGSVGGTISDGGGGLTTLSGTINSGGSQSYSAAVSSAGVTLNAGTGAISAMNAGNDFTGTLDVIGSSASITDMNALTIDANLTGALTTNSGALTYVAGMSVGSLSSTASGAVSQGGAVTVTGATSINAGANSITLTSANDFQGVVSLTGGTTQITDANALTLGNVNTGALATVNTGALNLGSGTINGALSSTTNGGNITQTGGLNVTGTTNLQAGAGSIMLAMANDFGGTVTAGGIGITFNDVNTFTPGVINAGSGAVNLSADSLAAGGPVSAGSASSFRSNTNVNGFNINMPNVPLSLTGSATQWNFISTPTSIPQPNPISVLSGNVGVTYNLASIVASISQQQAASASSSVSASVAAVIVDEANKTFGTDSVAEDVEYGFAGEIGATPPMDHRIDESGISLPRCVEESREGVPCK